MKGRIHRSACAVLALIALSLTGTMTQCAWKGLSVEIADFERAQVQGLNLWRSDAEADQSFAEAGRIVFGERYYEDGTEMLEYSMVNPQTEPLETWDRAVMIRGENEDAVTMHFIFTTWSKPPGWIRVSSFNSQGDSEPSEEAKFL